MYVFSMSNHIVQYDCNIPERSVFQECLWLFFWGGAFIFLLVIVDQGGKAALLNQRSDMSGKPSTFPGIWFAKCQTPLIGLIAIYPELS